MGTDAAAGFGEVLRGFRIAAGLSQEELADRAGLSSHGISDLERGARTRPYPATVQRLAHALKLGAAEIATLRAASRVAATAANSFTRQSWNDSRELPIEAAPRRHTPADQTPRIIGRDAELRRILSAVEDTVATGQGRVVVLAGEPGVGKTRLAREVLAQAASLGIRGFIGRCFEQHTAVPFFPFAEPFAATLAELPADLQNELRSRWPELGYIVPELGPAPGAAGQDAQLQVFRAAGGFMRAVAALHPFVLMLDDLHWADSTSLGLLLYVGRHLHEMPVLILATYRDAEVGRQHPLEATLRELMRERLLEEIEVRQLSLAGTRELVESRLGADVVSDRLVSLVHERARGNPFFIEELLAGLAEQAGATPPGADVLAQLGVPRSIRLVVDERVGRLPVEAQDALRLASVIGQEFDLDVLVAATDRPEEEVLEAMDAILAARLATELQAGFGERFAFIHALVQQTLYAELPSHRRRAWHLRVGEVLEAMPQRDAARTVELARHFLLGRDPGRAATHAIQAGDDAARRYAHAEAAHSYALALEALSSIGDEARGAEVQCRLGAELTDLDRVPEALAAYQAALQSSSPRGDLATQALAHWGLGRVHLLHYEMAVARTHLDAALDAWPTAREDADLVQLLVDSVRARVFSGDHSSALEPANRAVRLAEQLADPGLIARALVGLEEAQSHSGVAVPEMIELLRRAEPLARAASDWRTLTRVLLNQSANLTNIGALDESVVARHLAVEAADRSGDTQRLRFAWQAVALDCMPIGAWQEGRAAGRAGEADMGERFNGIAGPAVLAWIEGRYEDALQKFRTFWSEAREGQDAQGVAYATFFLSESLLQLDRPEDAEEPARVAAEMTRSRWPQMTGFVAPLVETLACLCAPDAEDVLLDAERRVEQTNTQVARPQLLRARARLLMQSGEVAAAIEALQASATVARSQHAVVQLGRTLALLADTARAHGDTALAEQADAERAALVEQIGPEVSGLAWARDIPGARGPARRPVRSALDAG